MPVMQTWSFPLPDLWIYGAPLVSDREGSRYLEYNAIEVGCMLELELTGDEVSAIEIVCQI
jgi:hypothetical protein